MIVTRSRLHAVRYKLAVDKYLLERGYPFKALVAFSGVLTAPGTWSQRFRKHLIAFTTIVPRARYRPSPVSCLVAASRDSDRTHQTGPS